MSHCRKAYADLENGQAHYRIARPTAAATAPPVVCLHMMPKNSRSFATILPHLARQRLALAPDFPAHGASDPLPEPASIAGYVDWLWSLLDTLDLQQPLDFVGCHTGSMVAVAATLARPAAVRRLINISAPVFSEEQLAQMRSFFAPIPLDEQGTRFTTMWERILRFRGPGMSLQMAAASLSDNLLAGEDYEEGHRAAFDYAPQYARDLGRLEHPLLVMNVADDLFEVTRQADACLHNGVRRDYAQWANGFLDVHAAEAAGEMLHFLDGA
jgi:pimeloyl-ACP methyl ester carboxylesterase